jgi:hypothetical protein
MALKLASRSETFKVVPRVDSALLPESDYGAYLESLNEDHLKFRDGEQPTRIVLRKVLPYGLAQRVSNEQLTIDDGKPKVNISFIAEEVRCSIVGIENPDSVPEAEKIVFKAEGDGGLNREIMSSFMAAGLAMDLYNALGVARGKQQEDVKKNS